jgi:L-aminopeptidase/D-esterase-like protein
MRLFSYLVFSLLVFSTASRAADFKFDFIDFKVGTAENKEGPTGCTVFSFPKGAIGSVDVRGGAAALREANSLQEENSWGWLDALVFAGGSTYGLEAASGVAREILKERKSVSFSNIPVVPAAIVYDFGGRKNLIFPDLELGARAFRNAEKNHVAVGRFGAGANVSAGKFLSLEYAEKSGQGAAFIDVNGLKIFAFTVVNALGNILNLKGEVILGSRDPKTGKRVVFDPTAKTANKGVIRGNTTLSLLITNAALDRGELRRLAIAAHTSMARVIEPFHTSSDGDTLFAVSTNVANVSKKNALNLDQISLVGGQLLQSAVLNAVESSRP